VHGPFTVATQAARVDGGVTLRLGVAWIPTVRLAGGVAVRHRGAPRVDTGAVTVSSPEATGRRGDVALDLAGVAAFGLDHRIDRHLIVGIAAGVAVAAPVAGGAGDSSFRTFEITIHAARYWYPR
jgi:hypothetical protein